MKPFWKRLRSSGAKVQPVATDLSPAYITAIMHPISTGPLEGVNNWIKLMQRRADALSCARRQVTDSSQQPEA